MSAAGPIHPLPCHRDGLLVLDAKIEGAARKIGAKRRRS